MAQLVTVCCSQKELSSLHMITIMMDLSFTAALDFIRLVCVGFEFDKVIDDNKNKKTTSLYYGQPHDCK